MNLGHPVVEEIFCDFFSDLLGFCVDQVLLRLRQFLTALLQEQQRKKSTHDDPRPAEGGGCPTVHVTAWEMAHAAVYGPGARATGANAEGFVLR